MHARLPRRLALASLLVAIPAVDPFFLNGPRAYPGADPDLDIFGCTPPE